MRFTRGLGTSAASRARKSTAAAREEWAEEIAIGQAFIDRLLEEEALRKENAERAKASE